MSFPRLAPLLKTCAWLLGCAVLFAVNLRLSQTTAANSDGASQALQAWDLLHGNPLQHGWITGDVAYYPNDVLAYALIILVHGLNADDVHWYGALIYTLAMLLAALLAMGRRGEASGRARLLRGSIAAGIMLCPQLQAGTYALLQGPAHLGSSVPILLAWLLIDRVPRDATSGAARRGGWLVVVAVAILLALTGVSDLTALYVGALPLVVVCGYRLLRGALTRRPSAPRLDHIDLESSRQLDQPGWQSPARVDSVGGPPPRFDSFRREPATRVDLFDGKPLTQLDQPVRPPAPRVDRFEIALAVAGIVAAVAGYEGARILASLGSLTEVAAITAFSPVHVIFWHNFRVAGLCLLVLAGANFIGVHPPIRAGFEILHLAGATLGAIAILVAAWRFLRDRDIIVQLLFLALIANLVTFIIGTHAVELSYTHEISDVLPFAAALAGRVLADKIAAIKIGTVPIAVPVLSLVLLGYLFGTAYELREPRLPAENAQLATWLQGQGLQYGLSGYWAGNIVTLSSQEHVRILPLNRTKQGKVILATQLIKRSWYDPQQSTANFVVIFPTYVGVQPFTGFTGMVGFDSEKNVVNTFGKPAKTLHYQQYTILVWNKNLLADMPTPVINAAG
ncbi:MAG TPA: hypothetical protein VMU95_11420 [Trebonia sp.]|nr:hypothetical protein [Trebonia sp.]